MIRLDSTENASFKRLKYTWESPKPETRLDMQQIIFPITKSGWDSKYFYKQKWEQIYISKNIKRVLMVWNYLICYKELKETTFDKALSYRANSSSLRAVISVVQTFDARLVVGISGFREKLKFTIFQLYAQPSIFSQKFVTNNSCWFHRMKNSGNRQHDKWSLNKQAGNKQQKSQP